MEIYGDFTVKVKHHMALHIPDTIRDYGPVCNFWCFPYERFNGVLGEYVHSTTSPEVQMFRKFMSDQTSALEAGRVAALLTSLDLGDKLPASLHTPSLARLTVLSQLQHSGHEELYDIQDSL